MSAQSYTLVVAEVAHVQSYIFGSNHLKENVGASYLVALATEQWAFKVLRDEAFRIADDGQRSLKTNLTQETSNPFNTATIDEDKLDVEVLYSGGGNFVALFEQIDVAQQFIAKISEKVLLEAPNLHFVCHHVPFKFNGDVSLSRTVGNAINGLKTQRSYQPIQYGMLGLGVSQDCVSTQLPAVWMERQPEGDTPQDPVWEVLSAEAIAKRQMADDANKLLREQLLKGDGITEAYNFPFQFDELGRSMGDASQVAVVHMDGNGMGKIIRDLFAKINDDRVYITLMRLFSERVKSLAYDCQRRVMQQLCSSANIQIDERTHAPYIRGQGKITPIELKPNTYDDNGDYLLPIRPLISGGDDISFVCDARLGLSLSAQLLKVFEEESKPVMHDLREEARRLEVSENTLNDIDTKLTACAGVAIVNVHYPFSRAYALAEDLCQKGKTIRRAQGISESALDWHQATGGLYGDLDTMRNREFEPRPNEWLTMRPLFMSDSPEMLQRWQLVEDPTKEFQDNWHEHQSKIHDLMRNLRQGAGATRAYREITFSISSG
ncbi:MAG: hypothetical protein AAFV93_24265, partial [Chloroflexota bacterium]